LLQQKEALEYSLGIIINSLIEWARGNVEITFNIIHQAFDDLKEDEESMVAMNRLHWVLGVLYFDLNEIEKSYHHYNICYNNFEYDVDLSLVAYTNIGLASVLVKKGHIQEAKDLFNETLVSSRKHGIWMVEARACHELGILYLKDKAYSKATKFIKLSYDIRQKNKAIPSLVSSILTLAEIDVATKQLNQAVYTLNEALEICKAKSLKHKESHIYRLLSDIYEKKGVFEVAFNMLKKHHHLEKELKNTTPNNKKNYLLLNYKAQKAEKESAYQKSINADLIQANKLIQQQKNRLSERNREKETLLKEIHHRVKNNLQIITSLLSLQSLNINNKEIKNLFANSQHRINSMALIHEMLYQTNNLAKINFRDYLSQLIKGLVSSFKGDNNNIEIIAEIPVFFLNIDTAIPLGLLINEIVTNALKYAFDDQRKGILWLSIEKKDSLNYLLKIGDNGPGIPDSVNIKTLNSLGLKLIDRLSTQLKGSIQKDTHKKGTHYSVLFQQVF
jgi:two-component sensor histidine kinase